MYYLSLSCCLAGVERLWEGDALKGAQFYGPLNKLFVFSGSYYFLWRAVYLEKDFPFSHTGNECLGRGKINKNVSVCPMIALKSKVK